MVPTLIQSNPFFWRTSLLPLNAVPLPEYILVWPVSHDTTCCAQVHNPSMCSLFPFDKNMKVHIYNKSGFSHTRALERINTRGSKRIPSSTDKKLKILCVIKKRRREPSLQQGIVCLGPRPIHDFPLRRPK
jgi:hypothetical protein